MTTFVWTVRVRLFFLFVLILKFALTAIIEIFGLFFKNHYNDHSLSMWSFFSQNLAHALFKHIVQICPPFSKTSWLVFAQYLDFVIKPPPNADHVVLNQWRSYSCIEYQCIPHVHRIMHVHNPSITRL